MTGLLCPIGRNLHAAWVSASTNIVVLDDVGPTHEQLIMISSERAGREYRKALDAYKSHRAACPMCREKFPCRRKDE